MLAAMAERLQEAIGDDASAARFSEHSLAVLMRGNDYAQTTALAERIREAFASHVFQIGNRSSVITASIGGVQIGIPGFDDEQKRVIAATVDGVRIVNLYVVNGQDVGTEKYAYKLRWLDAVHDWLAAEIAVHPRLVVLGDFNIAPDDRDVHDPAVWKIGSAHVRPPVTNAHFGYRL